MNIFRHLAGKFRDLKLRTKLILSYIFLIAIPTIIIGYIYYNTSSSIILDSARQNIYEIVKKNNKVIDIKLAQIETSAFTLILDKELYEIFNKKQTDDEYELVQMDRKVINVLNRYFSQFEDMFSAYIVTSYFQFGYNDIVFSKRNMFSKTKLYSYALESAGKLQWVPTYDIKDMFDLQELKSANLDYPYLFSAVKQLNITTVDNIGRMGNTTGGATEIRKLAPDIERPVLVINFNEEMLRNIYKESVSIPGFSFYIVDESGQVISHSESSKLTSKLTSPWLETAIRNHSGTEITLIDGKKMLICYDTLKVNGWVSAVIVPVDNILSTLPTIRFYTLYLGIALTLLAILLALLISGWIANPIKRLLIGIKRMGEGNFETKVQESGNDEIGLLVRNFNEMNQKINHLIEENYAVKIREKEAEIMALNLQLNPHFLSNTLNTINWMAIENNQNEISKMIVSLSTMLQYTVRNNKEVVLFKEDFQWLKSYIYIMSNRYPGMFEVEYDIDPVLQNQKVPKLFLQPFVENSMIHGFASMEKDGHIKISGKFENNVARFCVEDNGIGMAAEQIKNVMSGDGENIGIKNIDKRVKLIYGEQYGVMIESGPDAGTRIFIRMPFLN